MSLAFFQLNYPAMAEAEGIEPTFAAPSYACPVRSRVRLRPVGLGGGIRTPDLCDPNAAPYQTWQHLDVCRGDWNRTSLVSVPNRAGHPMPYSSFLIGAEGFEPPRSGCRPEALPSELCPRVGPLGFEPSPPRYERGALPVAPQASQRGQ